ncbi:hypothetical protein GF339_18820 [candidate division KSB3 bacterium]|uniref:GH16 domain-containing protein n=1 Tax=candidate division KSB3 bacterium TaxID=2044937 RepID=A0A9D5JYN1_9BACT|nr:hypothetical protein [candidate division KSB3 bacterium]MBD3326644.1 hypothetical protein [candidate division KSB3 bacterium]
MKKIMILLIGVVLVASAPGWADHPSTEGGGDVMEFPGAHDAIWQIEGWKPHVIGGYGDNFNYSGDKVTALSGEAHALVNAEEDLGMIIATVNGTINPEKGKTYSGEIRLVYKVAPIQGPAFQEGGVADFIYIHGDTQQGPPVMPTSRAFLATWGPVDVYLDGELLYKDLDGHMMYTERTRDPDTQAIYADESKTSFYSPKQPAQGYIVAPTERELHVVAHSTDKDPDNFPPNSVWIHLNFEATREK